MKLNDSQKKLKKDLMCEFKFGNEILNRWINSLTYNEKVVMECIYKEKLFLSEVCAKTFYSDRHIRRFHQQAIVKLYNILKEERCPDI